MKKLYNNRDYMALAGGTFISNLGDVMYNIALTIGLYKSTGDIWALALMWIMRAAFRIPVQFFAGIISDKFDKKKIIIWINLISAPIAAGLMFINGKDVSIIIFIVFVLQALNDVERNSSTSIVPYLVKKENLQEANSGFAMLGIVSGFMAPALAGLIYKNLGGELIYLINGATFLVSGIIFTAIRYKHQENSKEHEFNLFKFGSQGYHQIRKNAKVLIVILSFFPFAVLGRYYDIYKPFISDQVLNRGAEGIITFSLAMAVGGLISPRVMKIIKKRLNHSNDYVMYSLGLVLSGVNFTLWAYSNDIFLSLVSVGFMATASSITMISLRTIIQSSFEKEYLGRVMSFQKIFVILSAILGCITAPIMKEFMGAGAAVGSVAVLGVVFSVINIINFNKDKQREVEESM